MIRKMVLVGALAILAAAPGCTCNPEAGSGAKPLSGGPAGGTTSSATATQTAQSKAGPGEILWDVPKSWKSSPNTNAMRIATYLVGRAEGDPDDGEMSVSRVGGSVEANLGRWKAQFDPPKPDSTKRFERTIAGLKVWQSTQVLVFGRWTTRAVLLRICFSIGSAKLAPKRHFKRLISAKILLLFLSVACRPTSLKSLRPSDSKTSRIRMAI